MDHYNQDIRFDNIYISTYFGQIDERRKKLVRAQLCPRCPVWSRQGEGRALGSHMDHSPSGETDSATAPQG